MATLFEERACSLWKIGCFSEKIDGFSWRNRLSFFRNRRFFHPPPPFAVEKGSLHGIFASCLDGLSRLFVWRIDIVSCFFSVSLFKGSEEFDLFHNFVGLDRLWCLPAFLQWSTKRRWRPCLVTSGKEKIDLLIGSKTIRAEISVWSFESIVMKTIKLEYEYHDPLRPVV